MSPFRLDDQNFKDARGARRIQRPAGATRQDRNLDAEAVVFLLELGHPTARIQKPRCPTRPGRVRGWIDIQRQGAVFLAPGRAHLNTAAVRHLYLDDMVFGMDIRLHRRTPRGKRRLVGAAQGRKHQGPQAPDLRGSGAICEHDDACKPSEALALHEIRRQRTRMRDPLRLIIFDIDGTLVDSQVSILGAMTHAFQTAGRAVPSREEVLGIVGLSLPQAMAVLAPRETTTEHHRLAELYKSAYLAQRLAGQAELEQTLYPGAREAISDLDGAGYLLSAATGKARRGLDHFMDAHAFRGSFIATQTADDAPSKPHPGMVLNCLAATGVEARDAVMIGDTEFDMEMGRAAGVRRLGVSWGYHPEDRVRRGGAEAIARDFSHLGVLISELWQ